MFTSNKDLINRFEYKRPDADRVIAHEDVRANVIELALKLNVTLPEGREKALVMTKLQEVMFWANAAVALSETPVGK